LDALLLCGLTFLFVFFVSLARKSLFKSFLFVGLCFFLIIWGGIFSVGTAGLANYARNGFTYTFEFLVVTVGAFFATKFTARYLDR